MRPRCEWVTDDPLYIAYHDEEWGRPVHDDRLLFEFLILEGVQAGLSWLTILKKRENYRAALNNFDPVQVAAYRPRTIETLLQNRGLIRNRLKMKATVTNARACLAVQEAFGSLDRYIWQFVDGQPIRNRWRTTADIPAWTPLSDAMSRDLKKHGFRFVGPTICYAFMQAVGMVNDHIVDCFCYRDLSG
ncbi:MAG: DNA-3-methyladenine glycosylase I [Desulfosarcina sp.]|nr:DNA-3-methyladenine glycosylase I [Desulfobacterales bacterium]